MLLVIDVGNSNIKMGLFDGDDLELNWRFATDPAQIEAEFSRDIRRLHGVEDLEAIVVASVVPALNLTITSLAETHFQVKPLFVDHTNAGLKIIYDQPSTLGADRIADAVAAVSFYGAPCIAVDFGTATTFNVVNEAGEFIGGAISPGVMTCSEALFARTAKLPRVEFEQPERVIGASTVAAIQSGLYHGYVGLVDGVLEKIIAELGVKPRIIATGGLASTFVRATRHIEKEHFLLTLDGLKIIYERNKN